MSLTGVSLILVVNHLLSECLVLVVNQGHYALVPFDV